MESARMAVIHQLNFVPYVLRVHVNAMGHRVLASFYGLLVLRRTLFAKFHVEDTIAVPLFDPASSSYATTLQLAANESTLDVPVIASLNAAYPFLISAVRSILPQPIFEEIEPHLFPPPATPQIAPIDLLRPISIGDAREAAASARSSKKQRVKE
jgi:hypothetical protein